MKKREILIYEEYFIDFYNSLDEKVRLKVDYVLNIIQTDEIISTKFVDKIDTKLYEARVKFSSNIYRIFMTFDEGSVVVLFNGFQKKTQKTPKREIEKAKQLMNEYYNSKQDGLKKGKR